MIKLNKDQVAIYCDGACSGNPGPGGWGAVLLISDASKKKISGFEEHTTNNRMELTAAISGIEVVKQFVRDGLISKPQEILLYTDSTYVRSGMTEWIKKWKLNNWRSGAIKNKDLWMRLDSLCQGIKIDWIWVKGHNGDYYNELADSIAREAIKKGLAKGV